MRLRILPLVLVAAAFVAPAGVARADATVWGRARSPDTARRALLLADAEALIRKRDNVARGRGPGGDVVGVGDLYLREALTKLNEAGGASSPDLVVRARTGSVLEQLGDSNGCVRALEGFARINAPPPLLADAFATLAICHAKLGHRSDEIRFYDRALDFESDSDQRARLFANRAEAMMALGDLPAALAGYREAVTLSPNAPTTHWGLAVALDRSGNLDASLDALRIARSLDSRDSKITGTGWFFSPMWDEPYYYALGHWQHARDASTAAARTEHYLSAVALWEEFIQRAPNDDPYVPLARVRLKECERERDRALKRHPQSTRVPKKEAPSDVSLPPRPKVPVSPVPLQVPVPRPTPPVAPPRP